MTVAELPPVVLPTPTGPMRTYVYAPAAPGRYPGVAFFSEIFQITGPVRRTAALLAGHGFVVAAPEIYHEFEPPGRVLAYDQAGADRGNALKTTKTLRAYDDDARAVLDHLRDRDDCTGHLGTFGVCIGGHLSFRAAMHPGVSAGVCCYATDIHTAILAQGAHDDTLGRTKELTAEMLMVFGRQDPHVPREGRRVIYDAMTDAGVDFTWHEFDAQHAFLRDEGARYDPELAMTCYRSAIDLFRRKLGPGDRPPAVRA